MSKMNWSRTSAVSSFVLQSIWERRGKIWREECFGELDNCLATTKLHCHCNCNWQHALASFTTNCFT